MTFMRNVNKMNITIWENVEMNVVEQMIYAILKKHLDLMYELKWKIEASFYFQPTRIFFFFPIFLLMLFSQI